MSKLTKLQRRSIERALYHAQRAQKYIASDRTAVAIVDKVASTALHYTRQDGRILYEVAKDIGSDLCGLPDAIRELEQMLSA